MVMAIATITAARNKAPSQQELIQTNTEKNMEEGKTRGGPTRGGSWDGGDWLQNHLSFFKTKSDGQVAQ
jgi:hypothetical protein